MEEQSRSSSPHGLATMADQELQRVLEALQQREREVEKLRSQLKEVKFDYYSARRVIDNSVCTKCYRVSVCVLGG